MIERAERAALGRLDRQPVPGGHSRRHGGGRAADHHRRPLHDRREPAGTRLGRDGRAVPAAAPDSGHRDVRRARDRRVRGHRLRARPELRSGRHCQCDDGDRRLPDDQPRSGEPDVPARQAWGRAGCSPRSSSRWSPSGCRRCSPTAAWSSGCRRRAGDRSPVVPVAGAVVRVDRRVLAASASASASTSTPGCRRVQPADGRPEHAAGDPRVCAARHDAVVGRHQWRQRGRRRRGPDLPAVSVRQHRGREPRDSRRRS